MSVLQAVWRLLDQQQRRRLLGLQLLSIIMGLSTVGGIAAVLPFFTALADPGAVTHNAVLGAVRQRLHFDDHGSLVILLGVAFCAMVLIANTINLFGYLVINRFALRVGDTLYARLFQEYLRRDYEFHARNNSSVLATRVLHETARVTSGILQQGLIFVTNMVTIVCVTASMLLVNPAAAVAAVVALGASYAAIYAFARRRLLRNGQIISRYDAARTQTVNESFAAIREITLVQAHDSFVRRFIEQCRSITRATGSTVAISSSPRYILESITVFCLVGVALHLHSHTSADSPWIAQLSFVGFAAYRLLPALQQSFSAMAKMRTDRAALSEIEADLTAAPRTTDAHAPAPDGAWRSRPCGEIRLCGVSFRYAPDRPDAVSGVSVTFPAGTIVGFMGANGSGKSTLLDLISGLLTPQAGHIEVDGVRLERATRAAWQSTIAYVPQQVFLFDATLAENIAFGIPAEQIDYERMEAAVRLACLTDCVAGFPAGYHERLGEKGCRLSGGQRQRLAIARALYRGAALLIMDEATSSLDTTAENEIVETLHALRANRTVLVAAHRPGALRRCDLVFEMRNGRIVGSGKACQIAALKRRYS
jgi:ATP-binding cassette, subfamily B, bacterial PglK